MLNRSIRHGFALMTALMLAGAVMCCAQGAKAKAAPKVVLKWKAVCTGDVESKKHNVELLSGVEESSIDYRTVDKATLIYEGTRTWDVDSSGFGLKLVSEEWSASGSGGGSINNVSRYFCTPEDANKVKAKKPCKEVTTAEWTYKVSKSGFSSHPEVELLDEGKGQIRYTVKFGRFQDAWLVTGSTQEFYTKEYWSHTDKTTTPMDAPEMAVTMCRLALTHGLAINSQEIEKQFTGLISMKQDKSFSVNGTASHKWDDSQDTDPSDGSIEKLVGDVQISYSITYNVQPEDVELVFIPSSDYQQWAPEATETETERGNQIPVLVELQAKGKPGVKPRQRARFKVELLEVTKQPGVCLNFPVAASAKDDFDLEINSDGSADFKVEADGQSGQTTEPSFGTDVLVDCFDWAAYGKVKITATLENGQTVVAHMKGKPTEFFSLPCDDNNNHIADTWEKKNGIFAQNLAAASDRHKVLGANANTGDGFTLFEEYRGVMARKIHQSLSPINRNLIVENRIEPIARGGLKLFAKVSGINVMEMDKGELDETRVVNINKTFSRVDDQHGLFLEMKSLGGEGATGEAGAAQPVAKLNKKPKDCTSIDIDIQAINAMRGLFSASTNPKLVDATLTTLIDGTIAHELGHTCGLDHHGDKEYGGRTISAGDHDEVYDVKGVRVMPLPGKAIKILGPVGGIGGQCSGDVDCIMCYLNTYEYVLHLGGGASRFYAVPPIAQTSTAGLGLCMNALGTKINAAGNRPVSYFGDAAKGGNCLNKTRVKDY